MNFKDKDGVEVRIVRTGEIILIALSDVRPNEGVLIAEINATQAFGISQELAEIATPTIHPEALKAFLPEEYYLKCGAWFFGCGWQKSRVGVARWTDKEAAKEFRRDLKKPIGVKEKIRLVKVRIYAPTPRAV